MIHSPLTESEILARVLHRDGMMLVLDKPAGIAVHVTGHDKISLDQSFHHLQFGLPKKPELVHRLDRGTSGCLVLGRHRQALIQLGKLFETQQVKKTYRALVIGTPREAAGVIDRAILKSGKGSKWRMTLDDAGQAAVTEYKVLRTVRHPGLEPGSQATNSDFMNGFETPGQARGDILTEIEFSPKTGRTHQIRLHAAYALGCPVVGDPFYAPAEGPFSASQSPMLLHAESIEIPLKPSKPPIRVTAPLPPHWLGSLSPCGRGNEA